MSDVQLEGVKKSFRLVLAFLMMILIWHWNSCVQYFISAMEEFPQDCWVMKEKIEVCLTLNCLFRHLFDMMCSTCLSFLLLHFAECLDRGKILLCFLQSFLSDVLEISWHTNTYAAQHSFHIHYFLRNDNQSDNQSLVQKNVSWNHFNRWRLLRTASLLQWGFVFVFLGLIWETCNTKLVNLWCAVTFKWSDIWFPSARRKQKGNALAP